MSTVSITYLYTVEIFPTVVRGTCLGLCIVFAKIGSLCTPHELLSVRFAFPAIILELISGTYRIGIGKIKYDSTRISAFSLKYSF